jgi:hypothetical protein
MGVHYVAANSGVLLAYAASMDAVTATTPGSRTRLRLEREGLVWRSSPCKR